MGGLTRALIGMLPRRLSSVRGRILSGFIVAGLLPLVGALMVYHTLNTRSMREAEFVKIRELGSEAARQIGTIMDRASTELDALSSNRLLLDPERTTEEKLAEINRLVGIYTFFSDLTLYRKNGIFLGSTTPTHVGQRDQSRWLVDAVKSGKKSMTSPYKVMGDAGLYLTVYMPLGTVGEIEEVLTARVRFDEVWQLVDGMRLGVRGQIILLDEFGNVLAGRDKSKILTRFDDNRSIPEWIAASQGYYALAGEESFFTAHTLAAEKTQVGSPWTLLCFEPVSEVDGIMAENLYLQWVAAACGLFVAMLLGAFVSNYLSKPLELAAETAQAVKEGDFGVRMPTQGPREIKALAGSFNQMIVDLNAYRESMEEKVASRTERLHKAQEALQKERASLAERVELRTRELRAANQELARSARMKDEFLAGMSHELRTPLNAVLGLTESLEEGTYGEMNDRQLETLGIIDDSGRHLLSLINDILDVAKVESGEMVLDYQWVDVAKLCASSLNLVKQTATKKNLTLKSEIDPRALKVRGDERRLKQILVNLLSNAVKFTPHGEVGLEVKANEEEQSLAFTVRDTGIGIAEDQAHRLFQPFIQLDSRLDRQYDGTGLGLSLVYNFTEIHGGHVRMESEIDVGTRMTIVLPWREASEDEAMPLGPLMAATSEPLGKVLLADDHEGELMLLARALHAQGFEVHPVIDGSGAIETARLVRPDVIVLDMQMPGMDGLEATHLLRGEPEFRHTPIIGLTGLDIAREHRRAEKAGMHHVVRKPAPPKVLGKLISDSLQPHQPAASLVHAA